MLMFPNLGGETGKKRGIHFEDAVQSYIDASTWKPSDELRAIRRVHLLRRGDSNLTRSPTSIPLVSTVIRFELFRARRLFLMSDKTSARTLRLKMLVSALMKPFSNGRM